MAVRCKNSNTHSDKIVENHEPVKSAIQNETAKSPILIGKWIFVTQRASENPAEIKFIDAKKVIGNDGCNQFFGHYASDGNSLTFEAISATKKLCENSKPEIINNLSLVVSYAIRGDSLIIEGTNQSLFILIRAAGE